MKRFFSSMLFILISIFSTVGFSVVETYDIGWNTYPTPVGHEIHAFCSKGLPTDNDSVGGGVSATQSTLSTQVDIVAGETFSCYLRALRLVDGKFSDPTGVVSDTIPFPPMVTPEGETLKRR